MQIIALEQDLASQAEQVDTKANNIDNLSSLGNNFVQTHIQRNKWEIGE